MSGVDLPSLETPNLVAIYSLMRDTGMTLGVALGGSVFQNSLLHNLEGQPTVFTHDRAVKISWDAASLLPLNGSFPNAHERQVV